jgi:hypothetical protein
VRSAHRQQEKWSEAEFCRPSPRLMRANDGYLPQIYADSALAYSRTACLGESLHFSANLKSTPMF